MTGGTARRFLHGGLAAHRAGRLDAAEPLYRAALDDDPGCADALHLLGLLARERGDALGAIRMIQSALALRPQAPTYHFNLGVALAEAGRGDEAAAAYAQAAKLDPADARAWNNLGVAQGRRGALAAAEASLRRATALRADFAEAQLNLADLLQRLGQPGGADEAIAAARAALRVNPGLARAHLLLSTALAANGRLGEACDAAAEAASRAPDDPATARNRARLLLRARRLDEARAVAQAAAARGGADELGLLGAILLRAGEPTGALAACDEALAADPANRSEAHALAVSTRALALQALGRRDEAAAVLGLDRLIGAAMLAPEGFADLAAFDAALEAELLAHPTLRREPTGYVSRGGWLTGNLLLHPTPVVAALEAGLRRAIDAWTAGLPRDSAHPFLRARPERYRMVAWASILDAGGHLGAHIHEGGWISGACYVRVPEFDPALNAGDAQAGWIEFGRPPDGFVAGCAPIIAARRPEEGLLLLFPSSLHHRTIPFRDDGRRITISFNCYPDGEGAA